jgi:hypothetical protein
MAAIASDDEVCAFLILMFRAGIASRAASAVRSASASWRRSSSSSSVWGNVGCPTPPAVAQARRHPPPTIHALILARAPTSCSAAFCAFTASLSAASASLRQPRARATAAVQMLQAHTRSFAVSLD